MAYDAFISYSHSTDGRLAPAIRDGLQKLAKPWNRRRALNVFLDKSSLEVAAGLKEALHAKLEGTEWLILLLSEDSARSEWVGEEILNWAATKPADRIALVQTDGELLWGDGDWDWERSTAAPKALSGVYAEEPLWLDLRKYRDEPDLDIRSNNAFKDDLATLAAPLHGKSKEELVGEDLEQFRRSRRLKRLAITGLAVLTVASITAGIAFWIQRNEAIRKRNESEARRLATEAQVHAAQRTDLSLLLALESLRVSPTDEGWRALSAGLSRPVFARSPLTGHTAVVKQVAFSGDGELLASAANDGTVRLWRVASGRELEPPFTGHRDQVPESDCAPTAGVMAVAFSPDARLLASGDSCGTVLLWDRASRTVLARGVLSHDYAVKRVGFDAREGRLASVGEDGEVRLWRVDDTGAELHTTLRGHVGEVPAVVFADASRLVSAGTDGSIRLWDTRSGGPAYPTWSPLARGDAPDAWQEAALAFNATATVLAAPQLDWTVEIWKVGADEPFGEVLKGHAGEVQAAAFSPDGARLATASSDRTVRLWSLDLESGDHQPIGEPLTGHAGDVSDVTFSPDGRLLATAGLDEAVRLWDVSSGASIGEPLTRGETLPQVALSLDGSRLVSVNRRGPIKLWDVASRAQICEITAHRSPQAMLSGDGSRLASGGSDGTVLLWDLPPAGGCSRLATQPPAHGSRITALAFSTGQGSERVKLASADAEGFVQLWDLDSGRVVGAPIAGHDDAVTALAFSRDGSQLVSASDDELQRLRLWDATTGSPIDRLMTGHDDRVWAAAFYRDGSRLASVSLDGSTRLWDPAPASEDSQGEPLLSGYDEWVMAAFSPQGWHLVTGTERGTLQVWNMATGQKEGVELTGHGSNPTGLAFARGTAPEDPAGATWRRWLARAWARIRPGASTATARRGLLASAGGDGTVRLWPAQEQWLDLACEAVGRNLTAAEWREFGDPADPYPRQCAGFPSGPGAPEAPDPEYHISAGAS